MTVRVAADLQPAWHRLVDSQARLRRTAESLAGQAPEVGLALVALSGPTAGIFYTLALWRLGADLNWTGDFVISGGLFSHWQVWLAVGGMLQATGRMLERRLRVAYRRVDRTRRAAA